MAPSVQPSGDVQMPTPQRFLQTQVLVEVACGLSPFYTRQTEQE